MAQPFGATNQPHTCLWCGRKLRRHHVEKWQPDVREVQAHEYQIIEGKPVDTFVPRRIDHGKFVKTGEIEYGTYGDDLFCGLNCGYRFGLTFAEHGKRLKPKE